jgi:hypothetical protein
MKTKEISFTLPFVILLYEFMFFEGKILTRKNLFYLIPFLLTILVIPLSLIGIDKPIGDVIGELREAAQESQMGLSFDPVQGHSHLYKASFHSHKPEHGLRLSPI